MASVSVTDVPDMETKPKKINQYIGALVASLGGFSLGVSLAWNSSASEVLRNVTSASMIEIGLIGSAVNAGACLGVLLVPCVLRSISRIAAMFISIPINMLGWALICFAGENQMWSLILGRTICGIVGGILCVATPLYIAEIADKRSRSRLLTLFQLLVNCGVMYAFLVAYGLEEREAIWRYSLVCALACAPIALVNFLPESPLYNLEKGNTAAAVRSLRWYRGDAYKHQEELKQFEKLLEMRQTGFRALGRLLKNRRVWRSIGGSHVMIVAHQLSGINIMIFYALVIFNQGGSGETSGEELTLVVGAVQIISSLLCTVAIDRLGRRVLSTASAVLTGVSLILLGWYFEARDGDPELYEDTYGWMPPAWMCLFFAAFNIGLGPLTWSIIADGFPAEMRIGGATSAAFLNWLLSLLSTFAFGKMVICLGITRTMWVFAGCSWIAALFCALLVRDNTGMSMLEIQMDFATNSDFEGNRT